MAEVKNRLANQETDSLDDQGTDTTEGLAILRRLRDTGFDGDNAKLATALGRPADTVAAWMEGTEPPDDDIIMKARGIAGERGLDIE